MCEGDPTLPTFPQQCQSQLGSDFRHALVDVCCYEGVYFMGMVLCTYYYVRARERRFVRRGVNFFCSTIVLYYRAPKPPPMGEFPCFSPSHGLKHTPYKILSTFLKSETKKSKCPSLEQNPVSLLDVITLVIYT